MIEVELWKLVLFVVAGVAVGAIVVMLTVAKVRPKEGETATVSRTPAPVKEIAAATPTPIVERPTVKQPTADPVAVLAAAESRQEKVKTILNKRVSQKRNLTIDEAAKCLNVSPRRVRKLLEKGTLVPILMSDSSRQVSSVSVLDLIVRREAVGAEQENGGEAPTYVSDKDRAERKEEKEPEKPEPGPRQMYWYHVAGYDKPLHTLREALGVLGLEYPGADWTGIPSKVKKKIQRERIGT